MLRAIFAAMANAMRGVLGWCTGFVLFFVTLPFRMFGTRPRPQMPDFDIEAIKQRFATHHLSPKEFVQSQIRDSGIAYSFIAGMMSDNHIRPFPSAMSKTMKSWLQGLSYKQLTLLKHAGTAGIFGHVTGRQLIDMVPRQQPLKPAVLRFPPAPKVKDPTAPRLVKC
jgi:hypothetical protein